jgi:heme-degrading monooxygenase HmoA
MFSVIFEVNPKSHKWNDYLGYAKMLKPEIEQIDGFIDNVRYKSLRHDGWVLSHSTWRDEKSLVRWRVQVKHHGAQEKGRFEVFQDYRLRVGQITGDTHVPQGHALREQRLDVTEAADSKAVTLIEATRPAGIPENAPAEVLAEWLGLAVDSPGLIDWDVFDAILEPGHLAFLLSWADDPVEQRLHPRISLPDDARTRRVRIIRSYGMFDRREATQYYPEVARETVI